MIQPQFSFGKRRFPYNFIAQADLTKRFEISSSMRLKKNSKKKVINWYVLDFGEVSGGHHTIFRFIERMQRKGHTNNIYLVGVHSFSRGKDVLKKIKHYYAIDLDAKVYLDTTKSVESHYSIASAWPTAYTVFNVTNTYHKCYIVQDYEPLFYPYGAEYFFAENTYRMGLTCITGGPWLAHKLKEEFGLTTFFYYLGYDHHIYRRKKSVRDKLSICFNARHVTPRRGYELGLSALSILKKRMPQLDIYTFGWGKMRDDVPFDYFHTGLPSDEELVDMYRRSTVGLTLSLTNTSLVPLEMMACGLPVVEVKSASNEMLFKHNETILLAEHEPYAIAQALENILESPELQTKLSTQGSQFVSQFNWDTSSERFADILLGLE